MPAILRRDPGHRALVTSQLEWTAGKVGGKQFLRGLFFHAPSNSPNVAHVTLAICVQLAHLLSSFLLEVRLQLVIDLRVSDGLVQELSELQFLLCLRLNRDSDLANVADLRVYAAM